jgi:hypothetical protein
VGKQCEVVVLGLDAEHLDFTPEVWQTVSADPWQSKTLILSECGGRSLGA